MSVRRARHNLWTRVPLKRNWKQGGLALCHIARRETRAGVAHIILVVCHCCGGKLEQPRGCGRLGRWCANWAKVAGPRLESEGAKGKERCGREGECQGGGAACGCSVASSLADAAPGICT